MKYNSTLFTIPRPPSFKKERMSAENRAAQFAPFAALTGYDDEIKEVCRVTENCPIPGEDLQAELERALNLLYSRAGERPYAEILYFLQDATKKGGAFHTAGGAVLAVDPLERTVLMEDGLQIPIAQIYRIAAPALEE